MMRLLLTASLLLGITPALPGADDGAVRDSAVKAGFSQDPPCTQRQCDQIRRGMSLADATAVLGCPPGDYTHGKGAYIAFIDPVSIGALRREYAQCWFGQQGAIGLVLDRQGKVRRADWYPALDPEAGR